MSEIKLFDHCFVRLVDVYGSDTRIVEAARTSYQKNTTKNSKDRDLIRYLVRNEHTSPLEMCEVTFHLRLPLAISTQLIRHRTFNFNFESLRYSQAKELAYVPDESYITLQSKDNKQGGTAEIAKLESISNPDDFVDSGFGLSEFYTGFTFSKIFKDSIDVAHQYYNKLIKSGIRRELCRMVLPVAEYTECYAKVDLNNLFKFLKLRLDEKAQIEIRRVAEAMYTLVKPCFPVACEAFEDYTLSSVKLSRLEIEALKSIFTGINAEELICKDMSSREKVEFLSKLKKLGS